MTHSWVALGSNTQNIRWANSVGLMLGQRLRRWPSINLTFGEYLVFSGICTRIFAWGRACPHVHVAVPAPGRAGSTPLSHPGPVWRLRLPRHTTPGIRPSPPPSTRGTAGSPPPNQPAPTAHAAAGPRFFWGPGSKERPSRPTLQLWPHCAHPKAPSPACVPL